MGSGIGGDHDHEGDRTADLLTLNDVKRWTVVKTLRQQNVAEHSFNVAVIAWELAYRLGLNTTIGIGGLFAWALIHDAPEAITGDIDGKFKADNPELRQAISVAELKYFPWYRDFIQMAGNSREVAIVKLADKIEALYYIRTWGHGERSDDIMRELEGVLFSVTVPSVALQLGLSADFVAAAARKVLNHSTTEGHCAQLRRHRPGSGY